MKFLTTRGWKSIGRLAGSRTLTQESLFQDGIDCSTNPNYPKANKNESWVVSVSGKIGGAAGIDVEVGDIITCIESNNGGTYSQVGAKFAISQVNIDPSTLAELQAGTSVSTYVTPKVLKDQGIDLSAGNKLRMHIGTFALPSFSFTAQPDAGMYLSSITELGFATEATLVARMSVKKGIEVNWANVSNQIVMPVTPTVETVACTLTAAELGTIIITGQHTAGATQAYTLDTGANMDIRYKDNVAVNGSFDVTIINISDAVLDTITLTASAGFTIVGDPIIQSAHSTSTRLNSATFKLRRTGVDTWVAYRVS